jgi:molecular chaperone GrpE
LRRRYILAHKAKDRETPEQEGKEAASTQKGDIDSLEKQLAEETEKAEKYLENWQRAEADFSNYKKRVEQEKTELGNSLNSGLILNLLPVLDDMERALSALPPKLEKQNWVDGMKLIYRKFQSIMEAQGITPIEAVGKPFDPSIHEAVSQIEGQEGMVMEEIQKGYILRDRVLRPSMVVVGKSKTEE